jgi:hypothetical protein
MECAAIGDVVNSVPSGASLECGGETNWRALYIIPRFTPCTGLAIHAGRTFTKRQSLSLLMHDSENNMHMM